MSIENSNNSNSNNSKKDKGFTSIRISDAVKSKLQNIGHLGETYSEVIDRVVSQRLVFERIPHGDGNSSTNVNSSSSDLGIQELRI